KGTKAHEEVGRVPRYCSDELQVSADVARSHGGDGGGKGKRKPNLGGRAAGRLNTRDKTRNLSLKEITDTKGPDPIQFELRDKQTVMPLGYHAAHWSSYIGEVIRGMPLYYPSWLKVLKERKAALITDIGTQFDLRPHMESPDWTEINVVIQQHLQKAYNTNKSSTTQEYPSLIDTFFAAHTVNREFLRDEDRQEMRRLEATGTYTGDEINRLDRGGIPCERSPANIPRRQVTGERIMGTLNAASLSVIYVPMKIPMDLNNSMPSRDHGEKHINDSRHQWMVLEIQKQQARLVYPDQNQFHKEVEKIASSFYIMNFPDYVDAKRLWVECQSYERIVDAFIENKRSKAGKRLRFVRFLGVKNEEQLARSLASIWIGSHHLFVSIARFNRQEKNEAFSRNNGDKTTNYIPSQKADHVGSSQNKKSHASSLNGDRDSKVEKQVTVVKGNTLSNVPLTPSLITPALVLDDSCADNILEKFKVIFKGKVYMARAKELFAWTPIFLDHKEFEYILDDESLHGAKNKSVGSQNGEDVLVDDSDVEGVSETFFGDKHPSPNNSVCNSIQKVVEQQSGDLFCIYDVLNKKPKAGSSGRILCVWEATILKKDYATVSDNFIAIYETWISNNSKVVVIYAPQSLSHKRVLWDYISSLITRWNGETIVMGDFNEVRYIDEHFGSMFNQSSSRLFNHFITSSGLVDVKLEGYSFTWAHLSAIKMSKLDRFVDGFDVMVEQAWNSFSHSDTNGLIRFKKKLQDLKKIIRSWIKDKKLQQSGAINSSKEDLIDID
nr:RNA-directed DNA polymerase, eukaryota [Tanacetum cinerariifolium]